MKYREHHRSFPLDVLIFDMDGVLIDVSRSYRETIQRTVTVYLETCLGFQKGRRQLVTKEDISLFKSAGGFNNDWDLSSGLLLYALSLSGIPPLGKAKPFPTLEETILHLRKESSGFSLNTDIVIEKKGLPSFLEKVKSRGGGLKGVRRALSNSWDGWVYQSGDLGKENVVKRIFQEIYLGRHFRSSYRLKPLFYGGPGLYQRERLLIPREILSRLQRRVRLGIASGRPRLEAELALRRFHLLPFFGSLVTLDECQREEALLYRATGKRMRFSKPHPYSLLRVAREIGLPNPRCAYVGDVVDDMVAAQAAKKELSILAIGFCLPPKRKEEKKMLLTAGADWVIQNPRDLLQFAS